MAFKNDGTVVAWGDNYYGQSAVPGADRSERDFRRLKVRDNFPIGTPPARFLRVKVTAAP